MVTKRVLKYPFAVTDQFQLELPLGAKILMVAVQGSQPCVWALVDAAGDVKEARTFRIFGTGHTIEDSDKLNHVATFFHAIDDFAGLLGIPPNLLVWHMFEVKW